MCVYFKSKWIVLDFTSNLSCFKLDSSRVKPCTFLLPNPLKTRAQFCLLSILTLFFVYLGVHHGSGPKLVNVNCLTPNRLYRNSTLYRRKLQLSIRSYINWQSMCSRVMSPHFHPFHYTPTTPFTFTLKHHTAAVLKTVVKAKH